MIYPLAKLPVLKFPACDVPMSCRQLSSFPRSCKPILTLLCALAQVCRSSPGEKGKYIKIILALLQSPSTAVVYECAVTLVSLSRAPTAIRAAANCYCQLLVSQSDNNVKLIVLDRCASELAGFLRASLSYLWSINLRVHYESGRWFPEDGRGGVRGLYDFRHVLQLSGRPIWQ